jgi:predicted dinucleotide-binding enzyme
MQRTKVGILGSGEVGRALGYGFLALGHEVMVGSREPDKLKPWVKAAGAGASAGTFEQAVRFGQLIVLATLGTGTENAIHTAGANNFIGKVVIDTTKPLDFSKGAPQLSIGHTDSATRS